MGTSDIISTQRNRNTITLEQAHPEPRDQWIAVPQRVNRVAQPVR
ncbi:MAG: hypothetical protein OXF02_00645 [Simkaniaceae bacterium]|nr:hypothetical protein [Simkaniaceae bacterium]